MHIEVSCNFQSLNFKYLQEYNRIVSKGNCHPDVFVNLGCTYFFLGMYPEADEAAQKGKFIM
jgi:intraflagellar transport protein 56